MSDAAFSGLASIAMAVYRRYELVKKNQGDCEILFTQTKLLDETVKRLIEQGKGLIVEKSSIEAITKCFRDCVTFLDKVKAEEDSFATMFFQGGTFQKKLGELKDRLAVCVSSLHFAVSVATKFGVEAAQEDKKMAAVEHKGAAAARGAKVVALASPRRGAGGQAAAPQPAVVFRGPQHLAAVERKAKAAEEIRDKAALDDELIVAGKKFSKKELLQQMKLLNSILTEQGHPELATLDLDTDFDAGFDAGLAIEVKSIASKDKRILAIQAEQILGEYFSALKTSVIAKVQLRMLQ